MRFGEDKRRNGWFARGKKEEWMVGEGKREELGLVRGKERNRCFVRGKREEWIVGEGKREE